MPRLRKYLRGNPYYDPERVDKIRRYNPIEPSSLRPETKKFIEDVSRVAKSRARSTTTRQIVNGEIQTRRKVNSTLTAGFTEADLRDPKKRAAYRALRAIELGTVSARGPHARHVLPMDQNPKAGGSPGKSAPSGADKRFYDPTGKDYAVTTSGSLARLRARLIGRSLAHVLPKYSLVKKVIPCIQTKTRRQVMFAQKYAGKGYKVKHRHDPNREPC